jgi:hypothetical protein
MLQLASVTDSVVTAATHVIRDLGLGGVFLLMAADAMGIPIAAAAVMLFAGATGGQELLERHGRRIHIPPARIERAHGSVVALALAGAAWLIARRRAADAPA